MIIENGVIEELMVEPNGTGLTCSLFDHVLEKL